MHSTGLLRWQQLVTEMTNQRRRSPQLERETTWVNSLSDSSLSSEGLRSSRSWTCCCSRCSNCCLSSTWSPPFSTGDGTTLACDSACSFCWASFSLSISVERVPVARRLSRPNKFLRSVQIEVGWDVDRFSCRAANSP